MAFPKLLQKLFDNDGGGSRLNRGIMPAEMVGVDAQAFTDAQKQQARINIGAVSQADFDLTVADLLPVASVLAFAANSAPSGYLLCNGAEVSRTTYAALFAAIGTTYGTGDGSTTFNLPNLTDRFIQGSGTAGTVKNAGLPNILGSFAISANINKCDGAFSLGASYSGNGQGPQSNNVVHFNAAYGGGFGIYGNSDTVQPPALTMRYYIKY